MIINILKYIFLNPALLVFLILFGMTPDAYSQDWEGEIQDVEIVIVKDREITLPPANRIFDKVPPVPAPRIPTTVTYRFEDANFVPPMLDLKLRPLRMSDEPIPKLYGNYVKAGFGNFTTPYLEGYVNNKRDKVYAYGAYARFIASRTGPVDGVNSGSGELSANVFGKYFTKSSVWSGQAGFNRQYYHFYGYPPGAFAEKEQIFQAFTHFNLGGSVKSSDLSEPFQYELRADIDLISDRLEASERDFTIQSNNSYKINDQISADIRADMSIMGRSDIGIPPGSRNLFRLRPTVQYRLFDNLVIEGGVNLIFENDTLGGANNFHFYPHARAAYELDDKFSVFAGIDGDIERITYRSLMFQNPFLGQSIDVYNSNKTFEFYGGIKGTLMSRLSGESGISLSTYKNLFFFQNRDAIVPEFFDVVYDTVNTTILNYYAELNYQELEQTRAGIRADFYIYNSNQFAKAWHRPGTKITATVAHNIYDKILLKSELFLMAGIWAPDVLADGDPVKLSPAIDLNIKGEYLFSSRFSIFLHFNNIFGNEYQLLYNYPVRGFQVLGGATYSF